MAAFLMASPRLFEQGISLDPAVYAVVARNFARTGTWWSLKFSDTLFPQFFEQPFLIFWLQGGVFKVLGFADSATRILGLLFGSGTFYFLFRLGIQLAGLGLARVFAFLCLIDLNFVGRFATLYLEVPLTFFGFGALYFFYRWVEGRNWRFSVWSGLFLSGAYMTKGFAALPALGTIGLLALVELRGAIFRSLGIWLLGFVSLAPVVVFCLVQRHYGDYYFGSLYYSSSFVERAVVVGAGVGPWPFLRKLVLLGAPALTLSILSVLEIGRGSRYRRVFGVALGGAAMFVGANATLGFANLHYYYGIFPYLNLMAAVGLCALSERWPQLSWLKMAFILGLASHVFWNIAPFSMRRKGPEDFFRLQPLMRALVKRSPAPLETVGITEGDWIYRQFSNWYWDRDSLILSGVAAANGQIVIAATRRGDSLAMRGYTLCRADEHYEVWVKGAGLETLCRRN
ncbi:MAG: glycosyltransferase family 39 protein [Deltaproteobacteria bacterium]|nr:glycosyltransferase family 39 protein [Deltaproteobacteria bacterium]MBI3293661.1 glycosyltransferase family 39 protein [Deltaproteobacteria bacterium]